MGTTSAPRILSRAAVRCSFASFSPSKAPIWIDQPPCHENRSVPVRPANAALRTREYLTPAEVEKLIREARQGRYGHRDATLILIAFRHGLRASEICDTEWSQVEFGRSAALHVRRVKNGKPSVHPLRGDEVRALRELRRQFPDSAFVFATERGGGAAIGGSFNACKAVVEAIEGNRRYVNLQPRGEPRLGKRGLYGATGGNSPANTELAMLWVLNQSDGERSLLDISGRSGLEFGTIRTAAQALEDAGLLAEHSTESSDQ